MTEYIEIPEEFTKAMYLCKSRYRVDRTASFITFSREFWDGSEWDRSPFSDGIKVPKCVAQHIAAALSSSKDGANG